MNEYIRYFLTQFKAAVDEHKRAVIFISFLPLIAVSESVGLHGAALLTFAVAMLTALSAKIK